MVEKVERPTCSKTVFRGSSWRTKCSNGAVVERSVVTLGPSAQRYNEETFEFVDGPPARRTVTRWFCGVHDPERVSAREVEKQAKWVAERERVDRICASTRDLCVRLGCGHVHFSPHGVTGNVVLERHDVEKILKELGR
jgi:hypothetical protein